MCILSVKINIVVLFGINASILIELHCKIYIMFHLEEVLTPLLASGSLDIVKLFQILVPTSCKL